MMDCAFCGENHGPGPVGLPGTVFAGIEFKVCPKLPEDHFYEDREYGRGPRGALHRIEPERPPVEDEA
jgi:hypothetical protein